MSGKQDPQPSNVPQIARFMGPTWVPPGSRWPQVGPMLAPWTLLSGVATDCSFHSVATFPCFYWRCLWWYMTFSRACNKAPNFGIIVCAIGYSIFCLWLRIDAEDSVQAVVGCWLTWTMWISNALQRTLFEVPFVATTQVNNSCSAGNHLWACNTGAIYLSQWRHHGRDSVSNHQPYDCLLKRLVKESKKTTKLCVTGLCAGNSPGTGKFPAQMASNAENVSIWWRHHVISIQCNSPKDQTPTDSIIICRDWTHSTIGDP